MSRSPLAGSWLGSIDYQKGLDLQAELVAQVRDGTIPDQLLLLEHPHVITLGSSSDPANILASHEERSELGIQTHASGRGGDVTYHGPGQLVGYPIMKLEPDRRDIHRYLRDLEEVLIQVIANYGIAGGRIAGRTGVWTDGAKIAAIGVRVSSGWITSHGFALNVNTELSYFDTIVPCGLREERVTSIEGILGAPVAMREVVERTSDAFGRVFDREIQRAPAYTESGGSNSEKSR